MPKNFLRNIRKKRDLKAEDIANALDVSPQIIRRFERGDSSISISKINELLTYLNVSYEYLMNGKDADNIDSAMMFNALDMVYQVYGKDEFDEKTLHSIASSVYLQLPKFNSSQENPEEKNTFLNKMKEQYISGLAAKCFIHNK